MAPFQQRQMEELRRSHEQLVRTIGALKQQQAGQQKQQHKAAQKAMPVRNSCGQGSQKKRQVVRQEQRHQEQGQPATDGLASRLMRKLSPKAPRPASQAAPAPSPPATKRQGKQPAAAAKQQPVARKQGQVAQSVELSPARQASAKLNSGSASGQAMGSPSKLLQSVRAIGAPGGSGTTQTPQRQLAGWQPSSGGQEGGNSLDPGFSQPSIMRDISAAIRTSVMESLLSQGSGAMPPQAAARAAAAALEDAAAVRQPRRGGGFAAAASARGPSPDVPAPMRSVSPFGQLPAPPSAPQAPLPQMTESGTLAASPLSPFFMTSKSKALFCEMDDPGRSIAYPRVQPRRTGRLRRALASVFTCFVPPPAARSPAPSFKSRRASGEAGTSVDVPRLAITSSLNPLRNSLAELQPEDGELQAALRASLALADGELAGAGAAVGASPASAASQQQQQVAGQRCSPSFDDLMGMQEQADSPNMASPVLGGRVAYIGTTPPNGSPYAAPGPGGADGMGSGAGDGHARRSLHLGPGGGNDNATHVRRTRVSLMDLAQGREPTAERTPGGKAAGGRQARGPLRLPAPAQSPVLSGRHSGSKRGREAMGVSQHSSGVLSPKQLKRDLSRPAYRSEALHAMLSPPRPVRKTSVADASGSRPSSRPSSRQAPQAAQAQQQQHRKRSVSAPASPFASALPAGSAPRAARPPTSPLARVLPISSPPRTNRAAEMRAAASRRQLAEHQARANAYLAASPSKALRQAAAAGLTLRQAAGAVPGLASPGKTARPYCAPSTPAAAQVSALAAGESGAEPFSARLATAEKQRLARSNALLMAGLGGSGAHEAAAQAVPEQQQQQASPGASVDPAAYEAQRQQYLQMLSKLAAGLAVDESEVAQAKAPTPPPLPAELLAAAAAAGRGGGGPADDGAITVRPLVEAATASAGTGVEGEGEGAASGSTLVYSPSSPACLAAALGAHGSSVVNGLFSASPLESPSEPAAVERLVSLADMAAVKRSLDRPVEAEAAAAAAEHRAAHRDEQQERSDASAARQSISFGSVASAGGSAPTDGDVAAVAQQQLEAAEDGPQSSCPTDRTLLAQGQADVGGLPTVSKPAAGRAVGGMEQEQAQRAAALAEALTRASSGLSLQQLLEGGFTLSDVRRLKSMLEDLA